MKNNLLFAINIGKFPFKDIENAGRKTQTHKRDRKTGVTGSNSLLTDMQAGICTLEQCTHYHTVFQLLKTVVLSSRQLDRHEDNETEDRQ